MYFQTGHIQCVSPGAVPRDQPNKKPLSCRHCSRTFLSAWGLKLHEDIHRGIYPYKCPYCGNGFSSQTILCRHLVRHTGVSKVSKIRLFYYWRSRSAATATKTSHAHARCANTLSSATLATTTMTNSNNKSEHTIGCIDENIVSCFIKTLS